MDTTTLSILTFLILAVAVLYSSVGHGGSSGYLAAMALVGVAPSAMKPTALVLNILVATIAIIKYNRARSIDWSTFSPFAIGSVPLAFIGGFLTLPEDVYKPVVAVVLLCAAFGMFRRSRTDRTIRRAQFHMWLAILLGAAIGLLSGLTGVGGGIFISPLLLFLGWADVRNTSGVAAAFIWVNSVAGLAGNLSSVAAIPSFIPLLAATAIIGGWIGAEYGSKRLGHQGIQRALAAVLVIAGMKMMLIRGK